ncbi:MAG: YgiQ family radical SAM protein [Candidatus Fermentibacteraceae bacterium]|nr:YgiQ family radical SAM protein [Candidatus Fermentibacteraceae bacterium]MBN2607583.1 YgiQ family radical SAM protein [Candidatus Fermentibacteraceae bacterium]
MTRPSPVLPVSMEEMRSLGWDSCDVILVTGDAYVDHPSFGAALIGRHLESLGYRVGVIPQPDIRSSDDILRLGEPRLFIGVTSGAMDSMVNHYTSLYRLRSDDAYSEGGEPGRRPDRALLRYVNLVQSRMPGVPIVIGGIEAGMRRLSHYDFWSDRIRKSIILDTKAGILVYGMGERAVGEIASAIEAGKPLDGIRGTAVYMSEKVFAGSGIEDYVELPSHEKVVSDPAAFMEMTRIIESESSPWSGRTLVQRADSRVVVVRPPAFPLSTEEMDALYELPYSREPHPSYRGRIPAYEMICNSITIVRGCSGGCSFCALGLHQGRFISSRSPGSVVREVGRISGKSCFRGTITDLGGPTANLYGLGCAGGDAMERCRRSSCLYPEICDSFITDHSGFVSLLDIVSRESGVRNVFVSSGIRFDVALKDPGFIEKLARDNVSGYLKIAPEHFSPEVLKLMRKPSPDLWREFKRSFEEASLRAGKEQYIEPYILVAFPGCGMADMRLAAEELEREGMRPEKAQIFLPTPMTMATAMYCTGLHPQTREPMSIARRPSEKRRQLGVLPGHSSEEKRRRSL